MTMHNDYPTLSWKAQLCRRVDLLQFCIATGNEGLVHALIAQDFAGPQDHWVLNASDDDEKPSLQEKLAFLGYQHVESYRQVFADAVAKLEKLEQSSDEEYQKAIVELTDGMKTKYHQDLDTMKKEAVEIVRSEPEENRSIGADIFNGISSALTTYFFTQMRVLKDIVNAHKKPEYKSSIQEAIDTNEKTAKETNKLIESLTGTGESADMQQLADIAIHHVDNIEQGFKQEMEKFTQKLEQGGKEKFDQSLHEFFNDFKKVVNESNEKATNEGKAAVKKLPQEIRENGAKSFTQMMSACFTYTFAQAYILKDVGNAGFDGHKDAVEKAIAANTTKAQEAKKAIQDLVGKKENPESNTPEEGRLTVKMTERGWEICPF